MQQKKDENNSAPRKEKSQEGLRKAVRHSPKGKALDIGAGKGRNSLFLAKNGFDVMAIDKSAERLEELNNAAKKQRLKVFTKITDVRDFNFRPNEYSLIISVAAIDFLKKSEIETIIKKIKGSLIPEGIIYISVFSIKDPLLNKIKELNLKPIEENTFYLPKKGFYKHFFTKDEIKESFRSFKIIHLEEKRIKDTSHKQPHFHQIIELVAKKPRT